MKKPSLFLFLITVFFFNSCREDNQNKITSFSLIDAVKNDSIFYLSDFAKDIEYIKLEVNDSSYISKIVEIDLTDEFIFILDQHYKLYKFGRNGKFIKMIGANGEGPGEYTEPLSFTLFPKQKLIALLDNMQKKIIIYSFSGKFIRQFKTSSFPVKIASLNNQYITAVIPFPEFVSNSNYGITIYNLTGEIVNRMLNRKSEIKGKDINSISTEGRIYLQNVNDTLTYWEAGLDTVFKIIDPYTIFPKYALPGTKKNKPKSKPGIIDENFLWTGMVTETNRYIFITPCVFNNALKHIAIDKYTGKGYNMNVNGVPDEFLNAAGFINDIDGSLPICPVRTSSQGEIIEYFYACDMGEIINDPFFKKQKIKNATKAKKFREIINNGKINDNPVLMIVREK